jgi:hypothetical protein
MNRIFLSYLISMRQLRLEPLEELIRTGGGFTKATISIQTVSRPVIPDLIAGGANSITNFSIALRSNAPIIGSVPQASLTIIIQGTR